MESIALRRWHAKSTQYAKILPLAGPATDKDLSRIKGVIDPVPEPIEWSEPISQRYPTTLTAEQFALAILGNVIDENSDVALGKPNTPTHQGPDYILSRKISNDYYELIRLSITKKKEAATLTIRQAAVCLNPRPDGLRRSLLGLFFLAFPVLALFLFVALAVTFAPTQPRAFIGYAILCVCLSVGSIVGAGFFYYWMSKLLWQYYINGLIWITHEIDDLSQSSDESDDGNVEVESHVWWFLWIMTQTPSRSVGSFTLLWVASG
jgi:hypothetical protein